jgi:hypothetical protein
MNFSSQKGQIVIIRQIPILLLIATGILSLPFLAFSLFHLLTGTDAEGKWFTLFFGLFMGWLMLEFPATREKFEIDLGTKTMSRTVSGVFRRKKQTLPLAAMKRIVLELKKDWRGRRYQCLYICDDRSRHLVNSPNKNLDHRATGRLLSEVTGIPYAGEEQTSLTARSIDQQSPPI